MAEVRPLQAVHYDLDRVGSLAKVTSPPYDVIDNQLRSLLVQRSPHNVVRIDLPQGENRYQEAARTYCEWKREKILQRDSGPAYWALTQEYLAPDGSTFMRHGLFARVRVTEYGAGRIVPHERTHAGPKKDRLELTRATKANLSPIFSLYSDPTGEIWQQVDPVVSREPWAEVTDSDGTVHRIWRLVDPGAVSEISDRFMDKELLIADGHHRYETALAYSNEVGGEGEHNYTLMCLTSMEDPGLTVFPTHRVLKSLSDEQLDRLESTVAEYFEGEDVPLQELIASSTDADPLQFGYIAPGGRPPRRLSLRSQDILKKELGGFSDAYRSLDTAILESLVLKRAFGDGQDEMAKKGMIAYVKDAEEVGRLVNDGVGQAAFLMSPPPTELVKEIADAGETMPPKSTYFYPKLLTGLLFSPLE